MRRLLRRLKKGVDDITVTDSFTDPGGTEHTGSIGGSSYNDPVDETNNRSLGPPFDNNTGGPLTIYVSVNLPPSASAAVVDTKVGQVASILNNSSNAGPVRSELTYTVPDGNTYQVVPSTGSPVLQSWFEQEIS